MQKPLRWLLSFMPPYTPPFYLRNGHVQTAAASLFRNPAVPFGPIQIWEPTADGDEILVDYYRAGHARCVVLSHGLEGATNRPYILGAVSAFLASGWDVIAWNNRSCGGRPNRKRTFYHSGFWPDLDTLIRRTCESYREVFAAGFSMGGNITLKWMARAPDLPAGFLGGAAVSVPCDLGASSHHLEKGLNRAYTRYFLKKLKTKLAAKQPLFPDDALLHQPFQFDTLARFDDAVTAPLNGFSSADAYYQAASSLPDLHRIARPALILNAADDPFLPEACHPKPADIGNAPLTVEITRYGGHVGFLTGDRFTFAEQRLVAFAGQLSSI